MTMARKESIRVAPYGIARKGNLYFAYGANMAVRDMRKRCPGATLLGTAKLCNWRFQIAREGFATVVSDPGKTVFGTLWRLTLRDLRALDAYEEIDRGVYIRAKIDFRPRRGAGVPGIIYITANAGPGRPQWRYIRGIVESAPRFKFPAAYLRELSKWGAPADW